jgi:hypothetical protein
MRLCADTYSRGLSRATVQTGTWNVKLYRTEVQVQGRCMGPAVRRYKYTSCLCSLGRSVRRGQKESPFLAGNRTRRIARHYTRLSFP